MDRQHLIAKIRNMTDKESLLTLLNEIKADLLGGRSHPFTMQAMMKMCSTKLDFPWRTKTLYLPKKSGGSREISAPCGNLKWMLRCLNEVFKAVYTPSPYAMGFAEGRSIVDNALIHTGQNYVFNIDLSDFFPSISQARVWNRLQLGPFNFNEEVANIIAGLCSVRSAVELSGLKYIDRRSLPQGAPTSPILSNAVCDTLDRRLAGLAKRFGLRYSRYADDITFSSMHNVYRPGSVFRNELERIITAQNFRINPKKTRLHHRGAHMEVTGLTVGEKVNVSRKYVKDLRAILHIWERYGLNAALAAFHPRYEAEKGHLHSMGPKLENVIAGRLSYLKMVKGESDPVYARLAGQFSRLAAASEPEKPCERSWEYLFTESLPEFEERLGVKLNYAVSKRRKQYGYFELNGRRVMVSISKNLKVGRMPEDVQISLCALTDFKLCYDAGYLSQYQSDSPVLAAACDRMALDCPHPEDLGLRYYYLIHRSLSEDAPRRFVLMNQKAEDFKKSVIQLAGQYPGLDLSDDMGIIDSSKNKSFSNDSTQT